MKIIAVAFVASLAFGCATTKSAAQATGETLESAYDKVASGVSETARAGAYMVSRAGQSAIRVIRDAPSETASSVSDGWITTKVKAKMGTDRSVDATDIGVDTDMGIVTMKGVVKSEREAMKAIEIALETDGVIAVDSQLQFPTRTAGSRTYTNPSVRE